MLNEFKDFIAKGNVMDMAVGIIIGAAFTAIVTSLVDDLINPIISLFMGGLDFSGMGFALGDGADAAVFAVGCLLAGQDGEPGQRRGHQRRRHSRGGACWANPRRASGRNSGCAESPKLRARSYVVRRRIKGLAPFIYQN